MTDSHPTTDAPGSATDPRPHAAGRGLQRLRDDRGSATAEYAVVILAAVAFAGVLVAVMRSGEVQSILTELVRGALSL
jgi:Flp pilus assembly pilin Flp